MVDKKDFLVKGIRLNDLIVHVYVIIDYNDMVFHMNLIHFHIDVKFSNRLVQVILNHFDQLLNLIDLEYKSFII
jgi:hypothetical protein